MRLLFHSKSTTKFFKFKNNQLGIIQIIPLLLLLGGIVAGVWLVQNRTNLLPKASETNYIQIVDKDGNKITQTTDPNVYLKIRLPDSWELPSSYPSQGIVKEVYAQEVCPQSGDGTTVTFGSTTYDRCIDNAGGSNLDNTLCKTGGTKFRCFYSRAENTCISGRDSNDFNYDCPAKSGTTLQSAPSCKDSCGECPAVPTCDQQTYDTCDLSPCRQPGATSETTFNCYAKDNPYCSGLNSYKCNSCANSATNLPNRAAMAKSCTLTANPNSGKAPLNITFSVSPTKDIVNHPGDAVWNIDYGDGTKKETGALDFRGNSVHTYTAGGDHSVKFTATSKQDPNYNWECQTSISVRPVLQSIDIKNDDEDNSRGGLDPLHVENNLGTYITTLIPWRLNELGTDQASVKRSVRVTFSDGGDSFKDATADITLIRPTESQTPASKNEFLVDVFIDQGLSNQEETAVWVKDTINNYVNDRFAGAGITERLKVDKIFTNNSYLKNIENCPAGTEKRTYSDSTRCISKDGKIKVWLFNPRDAFFQGGRAFPNEGRVLITLPAYPGLNSEPFSQLDEQLLTHELGHIFNLPDYYWEDIDPNFNYVLDPKTKQPVHIGITAYIKDVMWVNLLYSQFSLISPIYTNGVTKIPISTYLDFEKQPIQYVPTEIRLKIVDSVTNSPLKGITVEVFSQTWDKSNSRFIIPNSNPLVGSTDQMGEIWLGKASSIFNRNGVGYSAFLRVTRGSDTRYTTITRSYLNYLYSQGQKDTAIITLPFSALVSYQPGVKRVLVAPGQPSLAELELTPQEREVLDQHMRQHLEQEGVIKK
ncbi:MAG: PKD domain-containing protein [Candidatus Daviesbacteria bacterium]|nr:MAG: PKD domain-containing protein [Candidatus Daviesbacteria bacterium]